MLKNIVISNQLYIGVTKTICEMLTTYYIVIESTQYFIKKSIKKIFGLLNYFRFPFPQNPNSFSHLIFFLSAPQNWFWISTETHLPLFLFDLPSLVGMASHLVVSLPCGFWFHCLSVFQTLRKVNLCFNLYSWPTLGSNNFQTSI